ncbi:hypothetical protein [Legionella oakridgensis]|uniref:Uncharacterized protein n=2 Tax=Legionella oakridgensis TaxID=29423 RepID=W0BF55_9GAMM|nr:hypothetical protein [Legionella oakridgensis]AHE67296.1 hypothetical protein Loa_01749 [Legionella oakridgensis ATCC 33761 = DSM 21215]ETO93048.1 hypothetical protein LOR_75c21470 [Legionella oakridgensis RV-2-2007]KTD37916.1 hypothetical protein Loak_1592 [Legionella oakridgensis]STY20362.1 Uncharacterised protein [Legionella longbeachae]
MPAPFFVFLKKVHTLPKVTSYDASHSPEARELQRLLDANDTVEYGKKLREFQEAGKTFRLTDMIVYETRDEGEKIDVRVALQVKGHSITWYFWVPDGKDQYPQAFRDRLYGAAAECHTKVERGCDLYYRGSNAFHVKTMHHLEIEAAHNHNHYRIRDNQPVTPKDLTEHLQAFKTHEVHEEFFEAGEVDELCARFAEFHARWTHKEGEALSLEEQYLSHPSQRLNAADILEFRIFGLQQEPCRISVDELRIDFESARRTIEAAVVHGSDPDKDALAAQVHRMEEEFRALIAYRAVGGSRGLGSERAMTRQIEGSTLPTIEVVAEKDDSLGVSMPRIPEWAIRAREAVERARLEVEEAARKADELAARDRAIAAPVVASAAAIPPAPPATASRMEADDGHDRHHTSREDMSSTEVSVGHSRHAMFAATEHQRTEHDDAPKPGDASTPAPPGVTGNRV